MNVLSLYTGRLTHTHTHNFALFRQILNTFLRTGRSWQILMRTLKDTDRTSEDKLSENIKMGVKLKEKTQHKVSL